MKRFLFRLLMVSTPVILGLIILEIVCRYIPNDYSNKANWLLNHSDSTEVLYLGSSHVFFGLNPSESKYKSYNAANVSQSLKYDWLIYDKYSFKNLKVVVHGISFFSLFTILDDQYRIKNYNIDYGMWRADPYDIKNNFHVINSSNKSILLFGSSLFNKNVAVYADSLGNGNKKRSITYRANDWQKTGITAAKRHTANVCDPEIISQNEFYMNAAIHKNKEVLYILLTTPCYHTYTDNIESTVQLKKMKEILNNTVKNNPNVVYLDWLNNTDFTADDFMDADHLNDKGAIKLTHKIDSVITTLLK